MADFSSFGTPVARAFKRAADGSIETYVVDVSGDDLFALYLASFPAGTNPILKTKTEHDCRCCQSFIRHAGNVVAVVDGVVCTVWDEAADVAPHPYNVVAAALRDRVKAAKIVDVFRVGLTDASFGKETTRVMDGDNMVVWHHFHTGEISTTKRAKQPDQVKGERRTTVQVFERGLSELRPEAAELVLSMIDANSLYRGAEHRKAVAEFVHAQKSYLQMEERARAVFVWTEAHGPAARFRNTVIGTLVQDLSEPNADTEKCVDAFGKKMDPLNYKRTSAVITPGMVKKAMETVAELGLEPALERRFARLSDISRNDVLWADGSVKPLMKGGIGEALLAHVAATSTAPLEVGRAETISLDDFTRDVLPKAETMELLLQGQHLGNLMSLTAPVHPEPKQLFRWANDFAWAYGGGVTDSIKERVKKAGGNVTNAKLRISLSWFNFDDLDIHVFEPGGTRIYYAAKRGRWGVLDVDMNAGSGTRRDAVENVAFATLPPAGGAFRVVVNNYCLRERIDFGFTVEVEAAGKLSHFSCRKSPTSGTSIDVVTVHMKKDGTIDRFDVAAGIDTSTISQEKWGLRTETFVKVNAVTLSPNYWGDNAVGNKHTFFVLDGAKNDEPCRGIFNEFLHPRLEQHRKVFELIGEKTKCQPTEGQLSGVGFSSTKRDSVIVKVNQGKKQRLLNVQIGG